MAKKTKTEDKDENKALELQAKTVEHTDEGKADAEMELTVSDGHLNEKGQDTDDVVETSKMKAKSNVEDQPDPFRPTHADLVNIPPRPIRLCCLVSASQPLPPTKKKEMPMKAKEI